jgi:hypothetical protein
MSVLSKSEIGFLKVIVRPLHVTLSKFLNDGLQELIENIDESIIEWEKKLSKALEDEREEDKTSQTSPVLVQTITEEEEDNVIEPEETNQIDSH